MPHIITSDARQRAGHSRQRVRLRAYCTNSHTAVRKLGLDTKGLGEVMAIVALFNSTNALAEGYQVRPDVLPSLD